MAPGIDAAASRVLSRRGIELVPLPGAGCCGALSHHLGREEEAKAFARRIITAYEAGSYDGVFISATGCGAYLKELVALFPGDTEWQPRAAKFAAAFVDFVELVPLAQIQPPVIEGRGALRVAYHPPCSLQNGLKLNGKSEALLAAAGFTLTPFLGSHLVLRFGRQLLHPAAGTFGAAAGAQAGPYRRRRSGCHRLRQYRLPAAAFGRNTGPAHRPAAGLGRRRTEA